MPRAIALLVTTFTDVPSWWCSAIWSRIDPRFSRRTSPRSSATMLDPSLITTEGMRGRLRAPAAGPSPQPVNDGAAPTRRAGRRFAGPRLAGLRLAAVHQAFAGTPAHGLGIVARFDGSACMITLPPERG